MSVDPTPVTVGDTFRTNDGYTLYVVDVAADGSWADVKVTHRNGYTTSPFRQGLVDGCLPYPADLVAGVSL